MSAVSGTPSAQSKPKLSRGSSERKWTAGFQLACGLLAIGFGITLITIPSSSERSYKFGSVQRLENTATGIWGGLIFVTTAVLYLVGNKNKSMVGVYFGFCILSLIISLLGLIVTVTTCGAIIDIKYLTNDCDRYHDGCCFSRYSSYQCRNSYSYHNPPEYKRDYDSGYDSDYDNGYDSGYDRSSLRVSPKTGLLDDYVYDSLECQRQRDIQSREDQECQEEVWRLYGPHQIVSGILIAVFSVEAFASAYGGCASIIVLCDCSFKRKRRQGGLVYFPAPLGQPVSGNNCNSWMMIPVVARQGEQGMVFGQPVANISDPRPESTPPPQTDVSSNLGDASPMAESTVNTQTE